MSSGGVGRRATRSRNPTTSVVFHAPFAAFLFSSLPLLAQSLPVTLSGPSALCDGAGGSFDAGVGYSSYRWMLDGLQISTMQVVSLSALAPGSHSLQVFVTQSSCAATATKVFGVGTTPSATVTAPASAVAGSSGNLASVPDGGPGTGYSWSVSNGTLDSGAGTSSISFTAGPSGSVSINVLVVAASGCSNSGSASVAIDCVSVDSTVPSVTAPPSSTATQSICN